MDLTGAVQAFLLVFTGPSSFLSSSFSASFSSSPWKPLQRDQPTHMRSRASVVPACGPACGPLCSSAVSCSCHAMPWAAESAHCCSAGFDGCRVAVWLRAAVPHWHCATPASPFPGTGAFEGVGLGRARAVMCFVLPGWMCRARCAYADAYARMPGAFACAM